MGPYAALLTIVILVLLQTTVMHYASLGGVQPFLPLLAVVSWSLLRGIQTAAWWALAAGLALDVLSGSAIGTYALPLVASVGAVGVLRGRLHPTNPLLPAIAVTFATSIFVIGQRALIGLAGGVVPWTWAALGQELGVAVLLNLLWLPLLFLPLRALSRRARATVDWER